MANSGLPPGAVIGPSFQTSAPPSGLPEGAVVGPSLQTAAPSSESASNPPAQPGFLERTGLANTPVSDNPVIGGAERAAQGFNKGLASTAAGIYDMAGNALRKVLPSSLGNQIPNAGKAMGDTQAHGMAEHVGGGVEEMAEWAAGDEALKGIVKLAATPQAILDLIEKHPTASKILLDTMKGGTVGGAQGAAKHASEGKALKGAVAGAEGGAIGSGLAAGTEEALGAVTDKLGITGLSPKEKLRKAAAGSASLSEKNFEENAATALPRIAKENAIEPIKDAKGFAEAAHTAKQDVWTGPDGYQPMIDRHANEIIDGSGIAQEIKNNISTSVTRHFPAEAKAIEKWADTFNGDYTLKDASQAVVDLNQRLRKFYTGTASEQFAAATAHPELGMLEDAANALRDRIDAKLSSPAINEPGAAELRKEYGALSQMQRVFEKRHIVYGRQAPIDIKQAIGGIAAAASGHPGAAVIPFLTKYLNSPGHLIQSAISDTVPLGGSAPVGSLGKKAVAAGKRALETGAGVGGENAAEEVNEPETEEAQ